MALDLLRLWKYILMLNILYIYCSLFTVSKLLMIHYSYGANDFSYGSVTLEFNQIHYFRYLYHVMSIKKHTKVLISEVPILGMIAY